MRNVKATIASIRFYCPEHPVCLIADGDFDTSEITEAYPVTILKTTEIDDPVVSAYCTGNPRSKLAAMWHGPFDRFVYLDADAVVWGDIMDKLHWDDEDFIVFWNAPEEPAHRSWMSEYYMDVDRILKGNPDFDWMHNPYFSSGAFACKRNAISKDEWVEMEEWRAREPDLFSWTKDQGILNYLVFWKAQSQGFKTRLIDLQWIPHHRGVKLTKKKFLWNGFRFPDSVSDPYIMHFCGKKPEIHRWKSYAAQFSIARYEFLRRGRKLGPLAATMRIAMEEFEAIRSKVSKKTGRLFKHIWCF